MNQAVKNKRKAHASSHREEVENGQTEQRRDERVSRSSSRESYSAEQENVRGFEQQWDYEKVKEVVSAVYTLATLFLTNQQKKRIDKINEDVSAILGVRTLADWQPPQPLLNIVGLSSGTESERYSRAA